MPGSMPGMKCGGQACCGCPGQMGTWEPEGTDWLAAALAPASSRSFGSFCEVESGLAASPLGCTFCFLFGCPEGVEVGFGVGVGFSRGVVGAALPCETLGTEGAAAFTAFGGGGLMPAGGALPADPLGCGRALWDVGAGCTALVVFSDRISAAEFSTCSEPMALGAAALADFPTRAGSWASVTSSSASSALGRVACLEASLAAGALALAVAAESGSTCLEASLAAGALALAVAAESGSTSDAAGGAGPFASLEASGAAELCAERGSTSLPRPICGALLGAGASAVAFRCNNFSRASVGASADFPLRLAEPFAAPAAAASCHVVSLSAHFGLALGGSTFTFSFGPPLAS
mmetsp:Transcript_69175/g.129103  ORF Transcript_69175/g.129103 Transcript_69175/m.129103 type:complete len:348 (+) Transcript_69175:672-1715(+)